MYAFLFSVLFHSVSPDLFATYVDVVEVNTYGPVGQTRTAVIYRDFDASIVAWRWHGDGRRIPRQSVAGGWLMANWEERGKLRIVYCRRVVTSRTPHDVEVAERANFPVHLRRGLR